jgi:membrane-associated phospholipid phosphatase
VRERGARWISIIGHPMLLIPIAIAWSSRELLSNREAAEALVLVAATMILFGAYVLRQVRRGVWSDVDVSRREHRPRMYLVAIGLTGLGLAYLYLQHRPEPMLRGNLATLGILLAGLVLNQTMNKVSLHAAFDVFAAAILGTAHPAPALGMLLLAVLVAESRVILGRHTGREAALGLALGVAGGAALYL